MHAPSTAQRTESLVVQVGLGTFQLLSQNDFVTRLLLPNQFSLSECAETDQPSSPLLQEAARQVRAFFAGELQEFDLPLDSTIGTEFQRRVWTELRQLPFGKTTSYSQLALADRMPFGRSVRPMTGTRFQSSCPAIVLSEPTAR